MNAARERRLLDRLVGERLVRPVATWKHGGGVSGLDRSRRLAAVLA
jgi:hypothetical protein